MLLGLGLAKASGRGGSSIAEQWLDPMSGRLESVPLLKRFRHPGWAMAATGATFLLACLRRAADPTEVVTYTIGVLVLAVTAITARAVLARRWDIDITQASWPPAIVLGLVTGAIGLPWAPLPVVRTDGEDKPRLHVAAPITLAALSLLLFVESAFLHTPITQAWAVAALIMSASTLLPIGPTRRRPCRQSGHRARSGRRRGRAACRPRTHLSHRAQAGRLPQPGAGRRARPQARRPAGRHREAARPSSPASRLGGWPAPGRSASRSAR